MQLQGNHYFPQEAVNHQYLKPSSYASFCPWKGMARYDDVEMSGRRNPNAAWYYPDPRPAAEPIRAALRSGRGCASSNPFCISKLFGWAERRIHSGAPIFSKSRWWKRSSVQRTLAWFSALLLVAGAGAMLPFGAFAIAQNVPRFLIAAAVMSAGYAASWMLQRPALGLLWSAAVGTRLILLFMHPGNDIWRYLWEGRVLLAGFNPYQLAPNAAALEHLRDPVVWRHVDHLGATAVYPPLAQVFFALMASLRLGVFGFKLVFALADLGVIALLSRRFGTAAASIYAWNPLVIYSFAGGGHYDSLFILTLLAALLLASSNSSRPSFYLSALLLGSSIAIKWASGPLVFWWLWRGWRRLGLRGAFWTGVFAALPMLALLWILFASTSWRQLGPHDWIAHSWSAPLVPGVMKWLTGVRSHNEFYLLPVLCAAAVIAWRVCDPWRAAALFFFSVLALSPAIQGWYFTWFIAVAASVPFFRWSARLVGISGFLYFWILYVDATQGVWKLSPQLTTLLWLPFVVPVVVAVIRTGRESV